MKFGISLDLIRHNDGKFSPIHCNLREKSSSHNFSTQAVSPRNDHFAANRDSAFDGRSANPMQWKTSSPEHATPFARERNSQAAVTPVNGAARMRFGTDALLWFSGIPLAIIFLIIILVHPH
jgi:hypothetical protein